jgi:hypothetical protein
MRYITQHYQQQKQQDTATNKQWLRWLYTTGFAFFFIKGLAWIAAAAWIVY